MSASSQVAVDRWVAQEGDKDTPCFPHDWLEEHWLILVRDHASLHFWVAHQPRAPEVVVRSLATSEDTRVRWRVAMKRNLPADLFVTMAKD